MIVLLAPLAIILMNLSSLVILARMDAPLVINNLLLYVQVAKTAINSLLRAVFL